MKFGTMKLGWSQHLVVMQLGLVAHPGIPWQVAFGSPQLRHAAWLQVGGESAAPTVNVVLMPRGNGKLKMPAVTHGVCTQVLILPPQSASVRHWPNLFDTARGVHSFGPSTFSTRYVFAIGWSATMGSQT